MDSIIHHLSEINEENFTVILKEVHTNLDQARLEGLNFGTPNQAIKDYLLGTRPAITRTLRRGLIAAGLSPRRDSFGTLAANWVYIPAEVSALNNALTQIGGLNEDDSADPDGPVAADLEAHREGSNP